MPSEKATAGDVERWKMWKMLKIRISERERERLYIAYYIYRERERVKPGMF